MTPEQTLANVRIVMTVFDYNLNAEYGDKYLSDSSLAMEAIDAILNGDYTNTVRSFLNFPIPG